MCCLLSIVHCVVVFIHDGHVDVLDCDDVSVVDYVVVVVGDARAVVTVISVVCAVVCVVMCCVNIVLLYCELYCDYDPHCD